MLCQVLKHMKRTKDQIIVVRREKNKIIKKFTNTSYK